MCNAVGMKSSIRTVASPRHSAAVFIRMHRIRVCMSWLIAMLWVGAWRAWWSQLKYTSSHTCASPFKYISNTNPTRCWMHAEAIGIANVCNHCMWSACGLKTDCIYCFYTCVDRIRISLSSLVASSYGLTNWIVARNAVAKCSNIWLFVPITICTPLCILQWPNWRRRITWECWYVPAHTEGIQLLRLWLAWAHIDLEEVICNIVSM